MVILSQTISFLVKLLFELLVKFLEFSQLLLRLLHVLHELVETHLKGHFTVIVECLEKVFAKEPAIPRVHSRAFFMLHSAEVEFIAISTFEEESTWNFKVTIR